MKTPIAVLAALVLLTAPALAQDNGRHNGFAEETDSGQGNLDNDNTNANPNNEGQTSEETTGPKGQLDKGNTGCNNCETEVDLPGANR